MRSRRHRRLLGLAVWHGGRWYVRRRFRWGGRVLRMAVLAGAGVSMGVRLARRLLGSR